MMNMPEPSPKMVERWARAYMRKHGKPPARRSGPECLPEGWTWGAIDRRLARSPESGLSRFLTERGITKTKEEFSVGMVERCARVYMEKHGKAPSCESTTYFRGDRRAILPEGWTWGAIDLRLRRSGGSLSRLLTESGVAEAKEEFSEKMVERCARAYKGKHGKAPSRRSGTECLPKGWTWGAINQRLGGLLKFLIERDVAEAKEEFSEKMVERCARAYKKEHGKAPSCESGAECLPKGWTWGAINQRLEGGLSRFLAETGIV